MKPKDFDMPDADVAWCPGCGNLAILLSLKTALAEQESHHKTWLLYLE
jgi:2-oxoglutarate ferredoxin oxidoreductase subunit beta